MFFVKGARWIEQRYVDISVSEFEIFEDLAFDGGDTSHEDRTCSLRELASSLELANVTTFVSGFDETAWGCDKTLRGSDNMASPDRFKISGDRDKAS